jgi:Putative beta-barrel porin 2
VLPALGTPMQVTHVALETDWGLWREVSVSGRFGYDHADYLNSIRVDNVWFAGARLNKDILRGLGVSLDYQYTRLSSNVPLNS